MKKSLILLLLFPALTTFAQDQYKITHQFSITGKIKNPDVITLDSLSRYSAQTVGDVSVTDHTGAFKHKDEQLKGVLLKDILRHIVIDAAPKLYSSFYFTCTGSDGYKVVYSWNELFNTEVGNHVYILTEKNGVSMDKLPENVQMASPTDFKTGRRYLHNLDKIVVSEAN